ncbi:MAG: rhodanese-like domain-containing protein [Ilumatobacteraceae bacterium]|jgi:rhodanese-related sulfurtransferase
MTIREVGADELEAALAGGARLVDVREIGEYVAGHVPEALLVPLGEVPDRVDELRGEGPAYVICRSGARSMRACEFLATRGIEAINVAGGTLAWIDSGRDVVEGDQPA